MAKKSAGLVRFREAEPDVTTTGIGKNYRGYRIFHTRKNGRFEFIENDGGTRNVSHEEREQFRKDLTAAARKDQKVASYLREFPQLGRAPAAEAEQFKAEPEPVTSSSSLQEQSSRSPPNPADTS
ncbi:MAG: hypothetical protein U0R44_05055 [Candidatus Micrarchaeia archaeon]